MVLQRAVFNTISNYQIKASVEHWLVKPILDPDKERGEIFRYMQLANTKRHTTNTNELYGEL